MINAATVGPNTDECELISNNVAEVSMKL